MKIEVFPIQTMQQNGALCLLLTVEQNGHRLQIMLDCGLNQQMEINNIKHYQSKIQKTKLILLSQASIECAGALPLISEYQINTLATAPIIDFGLRNFIDQLIHLQQAFLKQDNDQEEEKAKWRKMIESAEDSYNQIKRLNFGQTEYFQFENGVFNVSACPIRSGKTIGSCAWKIQINTLNIVYISDFNMQKELHIDSLNVDKLIIRNQKQTLNLHKEQIDLLIMDNYPVPLRNEPNIEYHIKNTIEENLNIYYTQNKLKGQLIFVFYPNERILEGVMCLDQIFRESSHFKGLKCEILSHYMDMVEKAGGFTDFLGTQFVNWKPQEQNYQSPFDPEYVKQLFSSQKVKSSNIILTTYNILFTGPLNQDSFLSDQNNIIVFFGQPPQFLNENMGKVRQNFRGELTFQIKDQSSINLNSIKKQLIKNIKKEDKLNSTNAPSTTYFPGSTTDQIDSQSIDQTKSHDKISDDSSSMLDFQVLDIPIVTPNEPLFSKLNYKQHQQLYFTENNLKENIVFSDQFQNPLRPMNHLFQKGDYGSEIPEYLTVLSERNLSKMVKQTQQIEEELENNLNVKQRLQESNFCLPKQLAPKPNSNIKYINAKIQHKQLQQNNKNTQMFLEYINPTQVLLLNAVTKPKQQEYKLIVAKQSQNQFIMEQQDGLGLDFVEIDESERNTILQVRGKLELHYNRNSQQMHVLMKLINQQQKPELRTNIQLIALFEILQKNKEIHVEIGFCQISINNGQIIVTRSKDGFEIEGYYCKLYMEIRSMIKQLNI